MSAQRILIVEDDPEICFLLSSILAARGREIVTVGTGEEAMAVADSGDIDLVVLDLILPDVDGRSLLGRLRGRPDTATVPVVVLTARIGPETRQECYALGADAFVEKPFDPEELSSDIGVRLERRAEVERIAFTDPLTGLLNRAGLDDAAPKDGRPFFVGLVDVDDFPVRSEEWGWNRSEEVVRAIAESLSSALGTAATLGRIGGGDFAFLVPGDELEGAKDVAGRASDAVRAVGPESLGRGEPGRTATVGLLGAEPGEGLDDALERVRQRIFKGRRPEGGHVVAEESDEGSSEARVLVAEDDEISATILLHRLEKEGLDAVLYDDGQEALEAAISDPPDLVILDVKMPGLDGFEVLESLRARPSFSSVPIIMLTSMGREADVVRGFRLGADDYILKPFSPTELSARVRRLLRRGRPKSAL